MQSRRRSFGSYTLLGQFRVVAKGNLGGDRDALIKRFGRDLVRLGFEPATGGGVAICEADIWAGDATDAELIARTQTPGAEITSIAKI